MKLLERNEYKNIKITSKCLSELKPNRTYIFSIGDENHEPTDEMMKSSIEGWKKAISKDKRLKGRTYAIMIPYWIIPLNIAKALKIIKKKSIL